jgi:N-acetylglucosaminyl-diphospho-decaprenol L-rhamnosyltransferase
MSTHTRSAGILILNWNGRELLREHLPSVIAAAVHAGIPVAVVDNGSTDGSRELLAREFPDVQVVALGRNLGFGLGYNAAMGRVPWDTVILLNNDMTVDVEFAEHLLSPFDDDSVFAVSAQIFFEDPSARRQETGRTSLCFRYGQVEFHHLPVPDSAGLLPVAWLGGGSAAVSRVRFEALGGFEALYSPFYVEDADLSFRAWRRGWATLLSPRSRVVHRHRGSTGRLDPDYVQSVIDRNRLLFVWLNLSSWRLLVQHVLWLPFHAVYRGRGRQPILRGLLASLRLLPAVVRRRRQAAGDAGRVMSDEQILAMFAADWADT